MVSFNWLKKDQIFKKPNLCKIPANTRVNVCFNSRYIWNWTRCRITPIMWSSCQTQPFCPVSGPLGRRWTRLNPNHLQSVILHSFLSNVRAKMPDTVGLGFTTASKSQSHQPLPGGWLEIWRLGAPYQLEHLFHLSPALAKGNKWPVLCRKKRASLTVSMCCLLFLPVFLLNKKGHSLKCQKLSCCDSK